MKSLSIATLLGFFSVLIWSTVIAFSRSLTESLGTLNTAFFVLFFSGIFIFLLIWFMKKKFPIDNLKNLNFSYFIKVGIFFVIYMILFYLAVGEAQTRKEAIIVGIINYLWPGLIFLFAVIILKNKANYFLLLIGILLCAIGTLIAFFQINQLSFSEFMDLLSINVLPYILIFIASISWAIYSNMTRKFQIETNEIYIAIFFFVSSFGVLLLMLIKGQLPYLALNSKNIFEFIYLIIFPSSLAYLFWDISMKSGKKNLVVSFSFFIPLISTLISSYYLNVNIELSFWIAAVLIVIGAMLCEKSLSFKIKK